MLEKTMAPHSSTLAWKIPWTEEPGRLQSMGSLSQTWQQLPFHFSLSCIGEGNGNPLQCPCLESPRDGGAWWAAVYGVAQSRTRLKRLSSSSSNTYIWNLKRWYWWTYLQISNGETDIENRLMDMWRGDEKVRCMERVTWKLTTPYVK